MNDNWVNINLKKLAANLLPINWRKPVMLAFVWSIIAPVQIILNEFQLRRKQNIYRVNHNWMICYLEAALNDEFDRIERKIRIDEPDIFPGKYIFTLGEQKPKYLGTMYIRTAAELGDTGVDFTVNMHGVSANIFDIRAQVDFYKLAGTRYNVINLPMQAEEGGIIT